MSALDEVRERDAKYTVLDMKWSGTPEATRDRRFLLSQLDALQADRDAHSAESSARGQRLIELETELDALKAAVKAAGPALEAAKDYVSTYGGFPLDGYAVMRRRDAAFAALKLALDPLTSADARRG